jgi:uncharacterized protein YacL
MLSVEFFFRIIGMVVFTIIGARFGVDMTIALGLPRNLIESSIVFGAIGSLFGLIVTPWITTRPVRFARKAINELALDVLLMAFIGLLIGLILGLLVAYPFSLLPTPFSDFMPAALSLTFAYLGMTIFTIRAREIWEFVYELTGKSDRQSRLSAERELIVDTSVLIDGRIVEIAETGFLGGVLIVPRFVITELHQVADSADALRRNRGRRGLAKLNELQRDTPIPVKIVEDDFDTIPEVDDKLVMLAVQRDAYLLTNDYNLNRVAEVQNVTVLNINLLSNAVRTVYIPGETFSLHVIQTGKDPDQGVGYLEDGTMVVVADGKQYMDRTITVEVTRLINKQTGRMIFAEPARE